LPEVMFVEPRLIVKQIDSRTSILEKGG